MAKNISDRLRQKIQKSSLSIAATAQKFNIHPGTVKRWRERLTPETLPPGIAKARERFVQDLEDLFQAAWEKGNFFAALRAKELLGKELGFLKTTKIVKEFIDPSLDRLSDENLENLLELLNHKIREAEADPCASTLSKSPGRGPESL